MNLAAVHETTACAGMGDTTTGLVATYQVPPHGLLHLSLNELIEPTRAS